MSDYWRKRQAKHIQRSMDIAETSGNELSKLYQKSCYYFNEQIQDVFDKYRKKHGLSETEAKALLNDLADPTSYDQMLKRLKAGAMGEERKELLKELEAPAYRHRINKLQESQKNLDVMMREVYKREKEVNTLTYIDVAYDAYFNSIYNLHNRTGIAFTFENIDPELTNKLLKSKWSGKNYSERIWDNTQNLANSVKEEMLLGVLTGKSEKEMADTIMEKFAAGAYNSRRLICTESDFISNALDMEAYREADIDMVRFCAVHDMKTSPICQRHDRSTVPLDKAVQGVNVPPLHPNCRSSTEPVINKAIEAKMKRRVRDPITGRDKIVSANQNYQEWLRNQQKEHGKDTVETFRKKVLNSKKDREQYSKYRHIFSDDEDMKSFVSFQDMKYNDSEKWSNLKSIKQSKLNSMDFEDMSELLEKLGNKEVRLWYKDKLGKIPKVLDVKKTLEQQAQDAFELRNLYRTQARDLMQNKNMRKYLDETKPNMTFAQMVNYKMNKYGLSGNKLYEDIIRSSSTSNEKFDKMAGVE